MTLLDLVRDRRVWLAAVVELVVQFAAALWLDGWVVGLAAALDFGAFAGYLAWLWNRGVTATSTTADVRRRGGG